MLLDEVLAKELQDEEEEWKHVRQMSWVIEETDRQKKLRQVEKEKQLAEEFEKIQKQLSEDLKQQMECNYQQKIQEIHRRSKMKQTTEIYRVLEPPQRNSRREGYEAPAPMEQLLCWRCGEAGHRKKACLKTLFCTNCGKNGHTSNKCRQLVRETCTYFSKVDHTEEYCLSRQLHNLRQDVEKPYLFSKPRTPTLLGSHGTTKLGDGMSDMRNIPEHQV